MAYTVQAAFNQFFDAINLNIDYREIANKRRDHLIELLGNKFQVIEAFPSGSIPKFTALQAHADLDIMLVLHYSKHVAGNTPTQVLQTVRDSLAYKTTVRKNGQAVTLHYTTWPSVDIAPVYYVHKGDNKVTHYCISRYPY
ncbi:MAG TPA: nucleotidyltransferase [Gallionella sp.]|nr:nucleotidyltransferase [Gallionella sp.]